MPVAKATRWARERAQKLVVALRALKHIVTQVSGMHADVGVPTTIESRTLIHITVRLVLVSGAVVDFVTPHEHR